MKILDREGKPIPLISAGQEVIIAIELAAKEVVRNVDVQIDFYDTYGHLWFITKNSISGSSIEVIEERTILHCRFPKFPLNKNFYYLNISVYAMNEISDEVVNALTIEVEHGIFYQTGKLPASNKGVLVDYQWTVNNP